jgi:ABC-2 type transport system permease protein
MSYFTILAGKVIAYMLICMAQFGLIMLVENLSCLSSDPHTGNSSSPAALIVIALSAAVAAFGYGMLLGTLARTIRTGIDVRRGFRVIAAAIGGIMVPYICNAGNNDRK